MIIHFSCNLLWARKPKQIIEKSRHKNQSRGLVGTKKNWKKIPVKYFRNLKWAIHFIPHINSVIFHFNNLPSLEIVFHLLKKTRKTFSFSFLLFFSSKFYRGDKTFFYNNFLYTYAFGNYFFLLNFVDTKEKDGWYLGGLWS